MAKNKKKISEKDFKKMIEIASQLSQNEEEEDSSSHLSIDEIKETARQLGIPENKIDQAYAIIEKQKEEARQKRLYYWKIVRYAFFSTLVVGLIGLYIWYINLPNPEFGGQVEINLTSKVTDDFQYTDQLEEIDLFKSPSIYTHLTINGLKYKYLITWEYHNPDGDLMEKDQYQLKAFNENSYFAYDVFKFKENAKSGTYQFKVYFDKQFVQEKEIKAVYKKPSVRMGKELGRERDAYKPVRTASKYSQSKDTKLYCHLYWEDLKAKGEVEFQLTDPQGKAFKTTKLSLTPTYKEDKTPYYAYATFEPATLSPGIWKIKLFFNGTEFGEESFEIIP